MATGATYAYSRHQPNVYDAGTLVYYQPPGNPLNGGAAFPTDRTLQDVAGLLYSRSNAAAVAKRIHYPGTPDGLISQVTISDQTGQDFIAISGSSGNPQQAAAIANGYAQQLVSVTNSDQQTAITEELQGLQKQLSGTGTSADDLTARSALNTQISTLKASLLTPTGTRQVSPATTPSAPSSPDPPKDAIFAFVLSLALGIAVAFGLERFDRRLKEPEDLARQYGLPLLVALPHSTDPASQDDGVVKLGPDFHEAFALLRTNVHLLAIDAPPRTIAVVSAVPGEGKSTIVRNLAITMAESGSRVAVIETDLRRPMQSSMFGLPAGPGLTDVLAGSATLGDVLHHVAGNARGIAALAQSRRGARPD